VGLSRAMDSHHGAIAQGGVKIKANCFLRNRRSTGVSYRRKLELSSSPKSIHIAEWHWFWPGDFSSAHQHIDAKRQIYINPFY